MYKSDWTLERIKALRKSYGENQEQFCQRFRVSVWALRCWEQGSPVPGPVTIILDLLEEKLRTSPQLQTA